MPWVLRSRTALTDCADELITLFTCSATDRLLEIVTPRILIDCTRGTFGRGGGAAYWRLRLLSWKIISTHLERFNVRLLARAHLSTLSSSVTRVSIFSDRMITSVSSAYLYRTLSVATGFKSDAVTTYGPNGWALYTACRDFLWDGCFVSVRGTLLTVFEKINKPIIKKTTQIGTCQHTNYLPEFKYCVWPKMPKKVKKYSGWVA